MRKTILAAIAATIISSPALAGGYNLRCTQSKFFGTNCAFTTIADPAPLTKAEIEAKDREIAKWEAFCKPVRVTDSEGLVRLRYAEKGCESGRNE